MLNKMRVINYLLPLTLLLILSLFSSVVVASFTNEWGEYQDNPDRRGFVNDESGQFNSSGVFTTIADGSYFQPLIFDADADGTKEIIGSDGDYLKIWYINGNTLTLKDERDMGGSQSVMMTALPSGFDGDDFQEFVVIFNWTNVSVIEYNGTSINIECTNETHNATTGITCINNSYMPATCFWGTNTNNVSEFLPNTCEIDYIPVGGVGGDNLTTNHGRMYSPPISDFDGDGNYELALACDHESDNKEDIMIVDVDTNAVDTTFSTDGIYELPDTIQYVIVDGLMFFNIDADLDDMDACYDACKSSYSDWWYALTGYVSLVSCFATCDYSIGVGSFGGGRSELFVTWHTRGAGIGDDDTFLYAIKNTGADAWTATAYDDATDPGNSYGSNPIIIPSLNGNDDDNVCVAVNIDQATDCSLVRCYSESGVLKFTNGSLTGGLGGFATNNLIDLAEGTIGSATIHSHPSMVTARMNSVTSDDFDFIIGAAIISTDGNATSQVNISNTNAISYNTYSSSMADVNDDGLLDICGQTSGALFCAFGLYTNAPPVINNSYEYGGYYYTVDVTRPICKNTSITFVAQECGGILDCNYDNDLEEDIERIVSNCGMNAYNHSTSSTTDNILNGSYDGSRPEFSCYYTNAENYVVRLYLEDSANENDRSSYNSQSFSLQVIDGEPGLSCNFDPPISSPGDPDTIDGGAAAAEEDVFENVWDEFGITSDTSQAIIGIAVVIGIMVMVGSIIPEAFAIVAAGILGVILVTFMGLISAYILVIMIVSMLAIFLIKQFVIGGGG